MAPKRTTRFRSLAEEKGVVGDAAGASKRDLSPLGSELAEEVELPLRKQLKARAHLVAEEPETPPDTDEENEEGNSLPMVGPLSGSRRRAHDEARITRKLKTVEAIKREAPQLQAPPKNYLEMEQFLTAMEQVAKDYGREEDLYELTLSRMDEETRSGFRLLVEHKYPDQENTYRQLVQVIGEQMGARDPLDYLRTEIGMLKPGALDPFHLMLRLCALYTTYQRLCKRLGVAVRETVDDAKKVYVNLLDERVASMVRVTSQTAPTLAALAAIAQEAAADLATYKQSTAKPAAAAARLAADTDNEQGH